MPVMYDFESGKILKQINIKLVNKRKRKKRGKSFDEKEEEM